MLDGNTAISRISDKQYLSNLRHKEKRLKKMIDCYEKELTALREALNAVRKDVESYEKNN